MKELRMIDQKISTLKDQLDHVKGSETEVYTRIVGYYRSIKNWNAGKRAEFDFRNNYHHEMIVDKLSTPVKLEV